MKRLITGMLILALSASFLHVSYAETIEKEETAEEIAALESSEYTILKSLKIVDDKFGQNALGLVTRADFARALYKFANINYVPSDNKFSDIQKDDISAVGFCVDMAYIDCFSDSLFKPDEAITYQTAVKAVVKMLGYEEIGRISKGYVKAADSLGLLKKVKNTDDKITYEDAARLLYNGLLTPMGERNPYKNKIKISPSDEIYLAERFDSDIVSGVITGTKNTELYNQNAYSKNIVKIGNKQYDALCDVKDYLGYFVEAVVQEIDGNECVIMLLKTDIKNNVLHIDAKDLKRYTSSVYTYSDESGKTKKANIVNNAAVIYNGVSFYDYVNSDFIPQNGYVNLIDNNLDGRYDVVDIHSFKTVVLLRYDDNIEKVYDKYINNTVDLSNVNSLEVYQEGALIDIKNLREDAVLSVAISRNEKVATILVSNETKDTVINSIDEETLTFSDGEYYIEHGYFDLNGLIPGDTVHAYFDAFGNVVYLTKMSADMKLGYMINARIKHGYDDCLEITVFSEDSEEIKIKSGKKVKIDGVRKKAEEVFEELKRGGTEVVSDIIRYSVIDDLLVEIDTPYNSILKDMPKDTDPDSILPGPYETKNSFRLINYWSRPYENEVDASGKKVNATQALWYKPAARTFGRRPVVAGKQNAKVFIVPSDPKTAGTEYFNCTNMAYFSMDKTYLIDAYSFDEGATQADVLIHVTSSTATQTINSNTVGIISEIKTEWNPTTEEAMISLSIGSRESIETVYTDEEAFYSKVRAYDHSTYPEFYKLSKGDIVIYDADSLNKITALYLIWDADETDAVKAFKGSNSRIYGDITSYPYMVYLDVYKLEGGYALCTETDLSNFSGNKNDLNLLVENVSFSAGATHRYNSTEKKVELQGRLGSSFSYKDLKDYVRYGRDRSRILAVYKWGYQEEMFIIE